jgi:protein-tyrosine-phosphatase
LTQPPTVSVAEFVGWLRDLDARECYDLIVPATELSLLAFRHVGPSESVRERAVLPGDEALDIALSKEHTWRLARAIGVPVPDSLLIEDLGRLPPVRAYPVVLKPIRSIAVTEGRPVSIAAAVVSDDAARLAYLRRWLSLAPVQQQAYVAGHGVGIEWLYDRERAAWVFAHERVHETPLTGGASCYRRSIVPPEGPLAASRRLLDGLQWHGVAMVEFRINADGTFWLMEVNPRLWGSLPLAIDAGVNFPVGLLGLARGEALPEQPKYRAGQYARNLGADVEWLKANFVADHGNPLLLTRPRIRSVVEYIRPLFGRERWDYFDWHDLGVTCASLSGAIGRIRQFAGRRFHKARLQRIVVRRHRQLLTRLAARGALRRLLFICQGNICRSPFAAALARQSLPEIAIDSAGLDEREGRRSPATFVESARRRGVELTGHRSRSVTAEHIDQADLILVMDLDNYKALLSKHPALVVRVTLLGLFANPPAVSIPDPYDMMADEADQVLDGIAAAIRGLRACLEQGPSPAN